MTWAHSGSIPRRVVLFAATLLVTAGCHDGSGSPVVSGTETTALAGVAPGSGADDDLRAGSNFFVAPTGDDANPGTESAPFRTLERARAAVRAVVPIGTGPIRVFLREGTYRRTEPFELLPEDSGRPERTITWRAYPGERAVISGLRRLDAPWTQDNAVRWWTPVQGLRFSSLFVNGARATRAREPDTGTYDMIVRPECCNDEECEGGPPWPPPAVFPQHCLDRFKPQPGSVSANFHNLNDVEIVSRRRWEQSRHHIERVEQGSVFVRTESVIFPYGYDYDGKDRYYVENAFEALDEPGEWYLDVPAERLYYLPAPGTDPNKTDFEVPVTDELLRAGDMTAAADIVSEDLVVVPSGDDMTFGNESFTIAVWLSLPQSIPKCVSIGTDPHGNTLYSANCLQPVLSRGDPFNARGYGVIVSRVDMPARAWASLKLRDNLGGTLESPKFALPEPTQSGDGAWTHFAWVVDRDAGEEGRLRTYVGGERVSDIPLRGGGPLGMRRLRDIGTWHNLAVGWVNGPVYGEPFRFEGSIDELHVVAGVLTDAGVQELYAQNSQSEALEPLHLRFESPTPTSAEARRPIVTRGRLRTRQGAYPNSLGAVFNELPTDHDFAGYLEHVSFRGLDFRGTDASLLEDGYQGSAADHRLELPAAITLVTRNAAFTGGSVTGTGAAAIRVLGADTDVSGNEIRDIGSSGVEIGRLPPRESWTAYDDYNHWLAAGANLAQGVRVLDNRIHAVGRRFPSATAVRIARNNENRVAGNRIYDTGYSGISAGWFTATDTAPNQPPMHDNLIERNEVFATMGALNDGAGIYIVGNQLGTVVQNNVIHDIHVTPLHRPRTLPNGDPHPDGSLLFGIYLDGTTANVSVTNNVTYRIEDGGLILGSGRDPVIGNHDNHVFNNVFVDGTHFQTFFLDAIRDTFERNIVYATHPTPVQAPFFFFLQVGVYPTLKTSDYNLWFRADGNYEELDEWRDLENHRFDAHSLSGVDPLFVDPANDDYTVPATSPAIELGFVPITTQAGPPADWCWEDSDCPGGRCIQRTCR